MSTHAPVGTNPFASTTSSSSTYSFDVPTKTTVAVTRLSTRTEIVTKNGIDYRCVCSNDDGSDITLDREALQQVAEQATRALLCVKSDFTEGTVKLQHSLFERNKLEYASIETKDNRGHVTGHMEGTELSRMVVEKQHILNDAISKINNIVYPLKKHTTNSSFEAKSPLSHSSYHTLPSYSPVEKEKSPTNKSPLSHSSNPRLPLYSPVEKEKSPVRSTFAFSDDDNEYGSFHYNNSLFSDDEYDFAAPTAKTKYSSDLFDEDNIFTFPSIITPTLTDTSAKTESSRIEEVSATTISTTSTNLSPSTGAPETTQTIVKHNTGFGYRLGVCHGPNWESAPIPFSVTGDDEWKGSVPKNKEFKFVLLNEANQVTAWEQGDNRLYNNDRLELNGLHL